VETERGRPRGERTESARADERTESERADERADLLREIVRQTGITDERILAAFSRVPRHRFVPEQPRQAYADRALPIGHQQTISQPSMIALMLAELDVRPEHRVLEVGAGSGYAAALLGELARDVTAIEIVKELAVRARSTLAELHADHVTVIEGNGREGYAPRAPYDRILVSAAPEEIPPALLSQLAPSGRIVVPIGDDLGQDLVIGEKSQAGVLSFRNTVPCIFVPLIPS